jgi:hypothetical protein
MSNLTAQEIDYLKKHFKTWLITDECHEIFDHILTRVKSIEIADNEKEIFWRWEKGTIIIKLQGDGWENEPETVWAIFGPPDKNNFQNVNSISTVQSLHGKVLLGEPESQERLTFPADYYDPFEEDEADKKRFSPLCDLGQNWVVLDSENLNSLKEPKLCFWSHASSLKNAEPYLGQDSDSYNIGGFFFRVLAHLLHPDDETEIYQLYSEFSLG